MQDYLKKTDKEIAGFIEGEEKRQQNGLVLIPSENYASSAVRGAVGSVLENKYAEGLPGKRYYTGNQFVDKVERLCQERAKKLFNVPYVNVQPYSGSPANLEIFGALCQPGDLVLSQLLSHGGHLSMGQTASYTGRYYRAIYYHLTSAGEIDWLELEKLAKKHRPKIIWSGGTAYTKIFRWRKYAAIAEAIGAYFVADISHIAGLVAGGAHPSPAPYAHVIMTTTHKTLRGPRGAMIMVTRKGLKKDSELPKKIDFSVFPGHQGGPHMNKIAGIAVALKEASTPAFKRYAEQMVKNSRVLAEELKSSGFNLIGDGSENHMVWIDLQNKNIDGWRAHIALEAANIYGNKQTIPFDPKSPYYPSGFRLGTPAVTTRGMKEKEMKQIAALVNEGVKISIEMGFPQIGSQNKKIDQEARKQFRLALKRNPKIAKLKQKVINLCRRFPVKKTY